MGSDDKTSTDMGPGNETLIVRILTSDNTTFNNTATFVTNVIPKHGWRENFGYV